MADRSGVLVLNKPAGPTSHDCVQRVRRVLGIRRVGHAGTLDPMACGVLVLGIGAGTRVLQYLQGLPKTYRAKLQLGRETTTQDTTGEDLAVADASEVVEARLREVLAGFVGAILQMPPMVSALKVGGRKLYELARKGEKVEREPRPITIHELDLLSFSPGREASGEIRVRCSSGTYVRTLCHDVGRVLGTGGAMAGLEREAVGGFDLDAALSLDLLTPEAPLISLAEALSHIPALRVTAEEVRKLAMGQFIPAPETSPEGLLRVLGPEGDLVAMAQVHGHGVARLAAPEKVFISLDATDSGA